MSISASKIRDVKSSSQKELASFKNRRSVSVDARARGSYVPDRRRPSSSEERKSGSKILRWSTSRKSSLNLLDTKRKDTRPLTDKAYQKKKVSEIVEFLNENGFSPPITASKLMAPSKKDFENIFQFMYKFFNSAYEVKKIEEEGPKILKSLRYPFTINKSAFIYVARTNWPSLLGALIWLMDLNKFAMKVDLNNLFETAGDDENAEIHKVLVRYICQCYHARMDNEEEQLSVFTQIIKSSVDLDEVIAENNEKKDRIEVLEKKINERKRLLEEIKLHEENIKKYEDFILKMKSFYDNKSELIENLMKELKLKESELKILQDKVSQKQDAYDAQGFDGKKHLNFFEKQKREITEQLDKKRTSIKEMQDKLWEAEIEHTKISEKIVAAVDNSKTLYNTAVESLKKALDPLSNVKIPQVQKLCNNFQENFILSDIPPYGSDVKCNVMSRDSLKNIARVKNADEILKTICDSLSQKLTEIEVKISELTMKLKLLNFENNKLEQDLISKRKITGDETSVLETQCEKLQKAILILQEEKLQLQKTSSEMMEEQIILQEFLNGKEKELNDCLIKQKNMFAWFSRTEEEVLQECEIYGNVIAGELEELNSL